MSASEYRCVHRFECVTGGQQKARITSVGWNLNKDKEAPLAPHTPCGQPCTNTRHISILTDFPWMYGSAFLVAQACLNQSFP